MKKILVCGGGGFIGSHLVEQLKSLGNYVIAADLKYPLYKETVADKFYQVDLRSQKNVENLISSDIDEIYQLAADMGGAGYIFTGEHDADIMHNSAIINLNILDEMRKKNIKKIFYSSSACMYPSHNQEDPNNPLLSEDSAYPANPDSEYGWEKLFSERLYLSYAKNYNFTVKIARLHNVFGPYGAWNNGKEKAPAALCRKVAMANDDDEIEIWGPGTQTRSFLYIDECVEGILKLMSSNFSGPVNLGSSRMISINDLTLMIAKLAYKKINIKNIPGPMGVMGRNSDNNLIKQKLNWEPEDNLEYGLLNTYNWILQQLNSQKEDKL